ncbi:MULTISPECIES: GreA/GreB family elongation factor [Exiguobacterium]|uniref:GreA/GreB family elongation factor n=1 Tax=Exiguobacterium TaxID=33986 RepID=UPI001BE5DCA6|nr:MULTISPECIES: transcription elongation factor GreA [Exiguobacterium]MCT4775955.1 transcription elongation factor GreA [Exiguobacterium aquaticum]MCT4788388.1 transcription elongation factor GreA [Exiguobacterium mexicanum]
MNHPRLTKAGRLRLQEQLETLRGDSRREALERVKTARKFCDFREDVTYADAVREQERIETKIVELERLLADAVIVDAGRPYVVAFGSRVIIRELPDGNDETYRLVGELEADLAEGTISVSSPLGSGLMGGVVGQTVSIASPSGQIDFEIVQIEP